MPSFIVTRHTSREPEVTSPPHLLQYLQELRENIQAIWDGLSYNLMARLLACWVSKHGGPTQILRFTISVWVAQ